VIVLDTTVLVYAVGELHEFREPCQSLVVAIERGDIAATTTVEVIQEFAHVRARRRSREDAARTAEAYISLLSPLLVVEESDLRNGLALFQRHPEMGAFDAVLAAAALSIEASALVSVDPGFADVKNLRHVIPNAPGLGTLLTP
jgi:predicted nucleic acid-binding protein